MVSIARGMVIEADLPWRLLAGKEPLHAVRPIRTGLNAIDRMALMEVVWYSRQLRCLAKDQATKPNESVLWSFCANLVHNRLGTRRSAKRH